MPVPDTDYARVLRHIRVRSLHQYLVDDAPCDVAEYLDDGMDALCGVLERFNPTRGVTFVTYATRIINGRLRWTAHKYHAWRTGRSAATGAARHGGNAQAVRAAQTLRRQGWTVAEICARLGIGRTTCFRYLAPHQGSTGTP